MDTPKRRFANIRVPDMKRRKKADEEEEALCRRRRRYLKPLSVHFLWL